MTQDQIKQLSCLKHIKIYKLHQLGLSKSVIAKELSTNYGHVYNVLKKYESDGLLKEKADAISL